MKRPTGMSMAQRKPHPLVLVLKISKGRVIPLLTALLFLQGFDLQLGPHCNREGFANC